jgi:hypothetical protein
VETGLYEFVNGVSGGLLPAGPDHDGEAINVSGIGEDNEPHAVAGAAVADVLTARILFGPPRMMPNEMRVVHERGVVQRLGHRRRVVSPPLS